jgi:phosphatidylserine decarboxylase
VATVRQIIPPIHPAGWPFIAIPLAVALLGWRWRPVRYAGLTLALACAAFFRNPDRVTPTDDPSDIYAPADGVICLIDQAPAPAEAELASQSGLGNTTCQRVSVFLSLFDVHVQRAPMSGEVVGLARRAGTFVPANRDDAASNNERVTMMLCAPSGQMIVASQVAGLIARRIVNDSQLGQQLIVGEVYGLMRFGSRVDLYLPLDAELAVNLGQRVVGGETVIARLVRS